MLIRYSGGHQVKHPITAWTFAESRVALRAQKNVIAGASSRSQSIGIGSKVGRSLSNVYEIENPKVFIRCRRRRCSIVYGEWSGRDVNSSVSVFDFSFRQSWRRREGWRKRSVVARELFDLRSVIVAKHVSIIFLGNLQCRFGELFNFCGYFMKMVQISVEEQFDFEQFSSANLMENKFCIFLSWMKISFVLRSVNQKTQF